MGVAGRRRPVAQPGGLTFGFALHLVLYSSTRICGSVADQNDRSLHTSADYSGSYGHHSVQREYVRQCHDSVIQSHTHPTHAGPHYRACRRPPTYFTHDESSIVLYHTRQTTPSTGATTTSSILHGSGQGRMQTAGGGERPRLPPPQKKHTTMQKNQTEFSTSHIWDEKSRSFPAQF